jgi:hypothetical protein
MKFNCNKCGKELEVTVATCGRCVALAEEKSTSELQDELDRANEQIDDLERKLHNLGYDKQVE